MRLRSIEIGGYKSFGNRTELRFDSGLTAIVGPNGSGKSNIMDALRWVIGEGANRSLRVRRLDDVIFTGSTARAPAGLAEVRLRLDNEDGWLGWRPPRSRCSAASTATATRSFASTADPCGCAKFRSCSTTAAWARAATP